MGDGYVSFKLLDRILKETAIDLLSKVTDNVEDRRVRWTTCTTEPIDGEQGAV